MVEYGVRVARIECSYGPGEMRMTKGKARSVITGEHRGSGDATVRVTRTLQPRGSRRPLLHWLVLGRLPRCLYGTPHNECASREGRRPLLVLQPPASRQEPNRDCTIPLQRQRSQPQLKDYRQLSQDPRHRCYARRPTQGGCSLALRRPTDRKTPAPRHNDRAVGRTGETSMSLPLDMRSIPLPLVCNVKHH